MSAYAVPRNNAPIAKKVPIPIPLNFLPTPPLEGVVSSSERLSLAVASGPAAELDSEPKSFEIVLASLEVVSEVDRSISLDVAVEDSTAVVVKMSSFEEVDVDVVLVEATVAVLKPESTSVDTPDTLDTSVVGMVGA